MKGMKTKRGSLFLIYHNQGAEAEELNRERRQWWPTPRSILCVTYMEDFYMEESMENSGRGLSWLQGLSGLEPRRVNTVR